MRINIVLYTPTKYLHLAHQTDFGALFTHMGPSFYKSERKDRQNRKQNLKNYNRQYSLRAKLYGGRGGTSS